MKLWKWRKNKPPTQIVNQFPGYLVNIRGFWAETVLHIKGLFVMNGTKIIFDTNAIINLLDRKFDMQSLGINVDEARLLTSVIVRMELLSKRDIKTDEERDIQEFLDNLIVVPLDESVEKKAVEIRRATYIKLPDCIVAATSIISGAILLTDDHHLLNLSWSGFFKKNIFL